MSRPMHRLSLSLRKRAKLSYRRFDPVGRVSLSLPLSMDLVLHKRIVKDCAMQMELVRAGLYEVVPIRRLSLLSCSDLRLVLHGNPYLDPLEWKEETKYELPYTKVLTYLSGHLWIRHAWFRVHQY